MNFNVHQIFSSFILTDVQLPHIDGFQLQHSLMEKDLNLSIIFISGHGDVPMSGKAMKRGAIDFLPKPFKAQDLIVSGNEALERDILDVCAIF